MDPVSAFSVASSVMTVIEFSLKTVSRCKRYMNGSDDRPDLREGSAELDRACSALTKTVARMGAFGGSQRYDEKQLLQLVFKCQSSAYRLQEELSKSIIPSDVTGARRMVKAIGKSLKTSLSTRKLDEIEKEFESLRKALDTRILVDLR